MPKGIRGTVCLVLACAVFCLLFSACGGDSAQAAPPGVPGGGGSTSGQGDPDYVRTPPPLVLAEYVGEVQQAYDDGTQSGVIDVTNVNQGYFAVSYSGSAAARVGITSSAGETDYYYIDNDGSFSFYPITRGNGSYTFTLYVPAGAEYSYNQFLTASANVQLVSEQAPFLVPNRLVRYDANSGCVAMSYQIAEKSKNNLEVVQQVYAWIADNIGYDTELASQLLNQTSDYEPYPDRTLDSKKGICYDYASLAAAMLRANGVPTKLIKGEVNTGDGGVVRHAWNMVWLEETGWIAAELVVNPEDWTRIDTTFAAGGSQYNSFIGDGTNYTEFTEH